MYCPSKCSVIKRPPHNECGKFSIENIFLPEELADIIAALHHRERAWHARLIICTTATSNIGSTSASHKGDLEIEEAIAFKALD